MGTSAEATRPSVLRSPRRLLLAALGLVCVGLAVAGAVLPGLPTTVFLIAASYLFTRSCPWLEERLIRNRFFKPYLRYLDASQPLSRRSRIMAAAMMWVAVGLSVLAVGFDDSRSAWISWTLITAAGVGTVVIASVRRSNGEPSAATQIATARPDALSAAGARISQDSTFSAGDALPAAERETRRG